MKNERTTQSFKTYLVKYKIYTHTQNFTKRKYFHPFLTHHSFEDDIYLINDRSHTAHEVDEHIIKHGFEYDGRLYSPNIVESVKITGIKEINVDIVEEKYYDIKQFLWFKFLKHNDTIHTVKIDGEEVLHINVNVSEKKRARDIENAIKNYVEKRENLND